MNCCYCSNEDGETCISRNYNVRYSEVIDQLPNIEKITLTGGEPSMCIDTIRYFSSIAKEKKIILQLNTNGYIENMDLLDELISLFDIIHFSAVNTVDRKKFGIIRGVENNAFDVINNNIKYTFLSKSVKTVVEIIIGTFNENDILELYNYYKTISHEIQLQPLIINGRAMSDMQIGKDHISQIIKSINDAHKKDRLNVELKLWCKPFLSRTINEITNNIECECGITSLYITYDGLVLPCNVGFYSDYLHPEQISLKQKSIIHILESSDFYSKINKYDCDYIRKIGLCNIFTKNDIFDEKGVGICA